MKLKTFQTDPDGNITSEKYINVSVLSFVKCHIISSLVLSAIVFGIAFISGFLTVILSNI